MSNEARTFIKQRLVFHVRICPWVKGPRKVNTPLSVHLHVTPGGSDFVTLSSWSFLTSWGQVDVYTVHQSEPLQNFLSVVSDMCLKTELKIIILASSGASTSLCKHNLRGAELSTQRTVHAKPLILYGTELEYSKSIFFNLKWSFNFISVIWWKKSWNQKTMNLTVASFRFLPLEVDRD